MIYARVYLIRDATINLSQALTIALRYSAVRRQGFLHSTDIEQKVLDYKLQQYRLLPLLAASYAFHFTCMRTE
jgi:acyl-CoA oxidase